MKIKDIIYREDAINLCEKWRNRTNEHHDKNGWYIADTLLKAIKELPSADRPQGEWIRDRYWSRGVGMGEEYGFFYKCSMCEYEVEDGYTRCGFNFCPYCGADMRKGVDDD